MPSNNWSSDHRVIAHIDMDAFYASIEILDNPELAGKPVIVGGGERRGVVSAASYEARAFGVHSAMPIFRAKRLCPGGIFLPVRMRRYREVSRIVMHCLQEFSPLVEQVSVDEAFIDLTGTGKLFGDPRRTAAKIKARIRERTSLTCSIGVSICKYLAKIASDMEKPDGLTVIPPAEVHDFLERLPVEKVPGIGVKGMEQLTRIGIHYVGDIERHREEWLVERFGKFGSWLLGIARCEDRSPVVPYTEPKSISTEQTLEEDTDSKTVLKRYLGTQSERVGRRLRKQGFRGKTVTIKIKHADFKQYTRSATLEHPTQMSDVIFKEAMKLLRAYQLGSKVRLIGVGVSNLESAGSQSQMTLFEGQSQEDEKWERVERAVDEIVERFGHDAVRRGPHHEE
ncbi:MAG: DNA polymerase IV [bacterium]|nr:MAG: DNA polymerase IV [bacterium]